MESERAYHSQVFVDLPNLVNDRSGYRVFDVEPLIKHIVRFGIGATHANHFYAYTLPAATSALLDMEREFDTSAHARIHVKRVTRRSDVDSAIVNDIWYQAVRAVNNRQRAIRHIVVSGDADYYATYHGIRTLLSDYLTVELVIFSWRDRCSKLWESQADRVLYLDDIPGLAPA